MKDIFDVIAPDRKNSDSQPKFDSVSLDFKEESDDLKNQLQAIQRKIEERERRRQESNRKLTAELRDFIRAEIAKIEVKQNVIERVVEKQPIIKNIHVPVPQPPPPPPPAPPAPPQIIKEVRVEVPAKDTRKLVEEAVVEDLKKEMAELKKQIEEARRAADNPILVPSGPGGPGVVGIPPPETGQEGQVLTITNRKATWADGGSSTDETVSIGDPDTNGSWRIIVDGANLAVQKRESGSWVEKGRFEP